MRKYNSSKLQAIEMENNKSVTAVEWLVEMLIDNKYLIKDATHLFEQAKQMMKEQIMEARMKAKLENIDTLGLNVVKNKIINDTEQYYKETYGKK